MPAASTPAIRHQLRFAIAVVAISAATGWILVTRMAGLMPFVILGALANAIRPRPRASRDTVSAREQAVAVAIVLVLVGLAVGGYSLDPAQTTLSLGIGAMLAVMWLLMLYGCTRDAAATFLDTDTSAAREAPVPTASMIRHQVRFAIAVLATTLSCWLASSIHTTMLYVFPFLLAIWIRPAPPRPKFVWSRHSMWSLIVVIATITLFTLSLHAAGEDSPITTWSLRLLFLAAWPFAVLGLARDAAATFPGHPPPTTSIEPSAP